MRSSYRGWSGNSRVTAWMTQSGKCLQTWLYIRRFVHGELFDIMAAKLKDTAAYSYLRLRDCKMKFNKKESAVILWYPLQLLVSQVACFNWGQQQNCKGRMAVCCGSKCWQSCWYSMPLNTLTTDLCNCWETPKLATRVATLPGPMGQAKVGFLLMALLLAAWMPGAMPWGSMRNQKR